MEPVADAQPLDARLAERLAAKLRRLRFGEVRLIVHDGVVVEIDVNERERIPQPPTK